MLKFNTRSAAVILAATAAIGLAGAGSVNAATLTQTAQVSATALANNIFDSATVHATEQIHLAVSPTGKAAASCPVPTIYGNTGATPCGDFYSSFDFGGGNVEYFAIGTNYYIYTTWKGHGWEVLNNGRADTVSGNGVANNGNASNLTIDTYGTDGNIWCDARGSGTWTGWYRC